ncbi:hypothetical protein BEN78_01730 [Xanthomonas citri pv. mangiferaeindicae]|nr:hypothetical protein BEN78_01730 [Xanthomonas citri pv. mangiferaeindicae]
MALAGVPPQRLELLQRPSLLAQQGAAQAADLAEVGGLSPAISAASRASANAWVIRLGSNWVWC